MGGRGGREAGRQGGREAGQGGRNIRTKPLLLRRELRRRLHFEETCEKPERGSGVFSVHFTVHFERKVGNLKSFQKRKLEKNFCKYRMYIKSSFMEFLNPVEYI